MGRRMVEPPGQRVHQPRNTYPSFGTDECHCRRIIGRAVRDICNLLANDREAAASCPCALPVAVKVIAALYFFASGSSQHHCRCVTIDYIHSYTRYHSD